MARERIPRGEVLQAAYGVLDKYKMNRSFFVKTEQTNCETLPPPIEAIDPLAQKADVEKETVTPTVNQTESEEESDEVLNAEDVIVIKV